MDESTADRTRPSILVVDDDATLLELMVCILEKEGYEAVAVRSAEDALGMLSRRDFDVVISDQRMSGMSGVELLGNIRRSGAPVAVIIATAYGSIDAAVEAMREGAADYLTKPVSAEDLALKVRRALREKRLEAENRWLHEELAAAWRPGRMVAASAKMRRLVETAEKLAQSDATVLIEGESGTGKELLAHALHYGGGRASGPFVAVNCAAIPAGLVESELFGHAKGSFTGAVRDSAGKMELADKGTLFLDEVGELPAETQPKLLRALQERAFERVGEQKLRRVDVRFVAATNRDLQAQVREGKFREDLYFRLAVVPLRVPPLRERPEDIGPLARYLVRRFAGDDAPDLTDDAIAELSRRPWRGNVRELANVIEHILALHDGGPITAASIPPQTGQGTAPEPVSAGVAVEGGPLVVLPANGAPLDAMIRDLLVQALERKGWNQSAAARLLRIPRHILQYRMQKYTIAPPGRG